MRTILAVFIAALLLGACGSGQAPPAEEAAPAEEASGTQAEQLYESTGTIESIEGGRVTLAHNEIPGLMAAMTMPFSVDDPSLLEGLEPGMKVRFRLRATASRYVIVEITPLTE